MVATMEVCPINVFPLTFLFIIYYCLAVIDLCIAFFVPPIFTGYGGGYGGGGYGGGYGGGGYGGGGYSGG